MQAIGNVIPRGAKESMSWVLEGVTKERRGSGLD